jgi:hypothetical protein
VKAIRLISDQFKISEIPFEDDPPAQVQPMIDRLRQLYNQYLLKNTTRIGDIHRPGSH